jgi:hypothetical protein
MTEEEWFACREPTELLSAACLHVSVRKLRLVIARCCEAVAAEVATVEVKSVLGVLAEAGPDGFFDRVETSRPLSQAAAELAADFWERQIDFTGRPVAMTCDALTFVRDLLPGQVRPDHPGFADLVRDVVPPFGIQPRVRAFWLRRNDGAAARLAHTICDEKRFAEMPVLADALEDAGCDDDRILAHCRTGAHGPGCWVLDLLLRGRD